MAIALDAVSNGENTPAVSPLTFSHPMGSVSNGVLRVFIQAIGDPITGVTFNGVGMTQLISQAVSGSLRLYCYELANPASGAHNVVISYTAGSQFVRGVAASYSGALQDETLDASATANGGDPATSITNSITPIADNCWVSIFTYASLTGITGGNNVTIRREGTDGQISYGDNNEAVTPPASYSQTVNYTSTSTASIIQVSLAPVPVPVPVGGVSSLGLMGVGS